MSVTVNPSLLYGYKASLMQTKYIQPVTENPLFPSVPFTTGEDWEKEVLLYMQQIWQLYQNPTSDYELELLICLYQIWALLYRHLDFSLQPSPSDARELERLRMIITFIHEHYMEHITLEDIASCASMCKSECCRLFKRNMSQSLFDYLLHYRIRQSLPLLALGKDSMQCGFSSPSYYTKLFRRFMNCTPREYMTSLH